MNHTEKHREFSMKYCSGLDDHVVVMTTERDGVKNSLCLSSHLCHADERKACGQTSPFQTEQSYSYIKI
ncbi:MAG: hypothetical protein IJ489_00405 [Clostridia bacterium]|nr:hypothetical protein [Clostridia bacterium]